MTIWRMCMACWIPKATNAHSEYVIFTAFPMEQWLDMNVRQFYVVHTLPACIIQFVPLATERGISLIILPCSINQAHYRHTLQRHTTDTHYRHTLRTRTTDTHYKHALQTHTTDTHYRHTIRTHTTDTHYRHTLQTRTTDTHYRHTLQTRTTDTHYRHIPLHFSHTERTPVQISLQYLHCCYNY